jgi:hypothetical protein
MQYQTSLNYYNPACIIVIAKECPTLSSPRNGTVSCMPMDKQTTGAVCAFDCDGGFQRQGTRNRVCLGDSWTGSRAVCDPYECDRLEAPTNGALLFPCDRDYGTSCSVLCTFGFMLQGSSKQSCVLVDGSRTEVEWTDPPVCIGRCTCMIKCVCEWLYAWPIEWFKFDARSPYS